MRFGWPEIIIIVFVVLLLFGAKKIPELMRSIGQGVNSFKKGLNEVEKEIESAGNEQDKSGGNNNKEEK